MSSKNVEARVIDYFKNTELSTAKAIMNVVKGVIKERSVTNDGRVAAPVKTRKKRTPKNAVAPKGTGGATSFPGTEAAAS